jgi:hypothetical protein
MFNCSNSGLVAPPRSHLALPLARMTGFPNLAAQNLPEHVLGAGFARTPANGRLTAKALADAHFNCILVGTTVYNDAFLKKDPVARTKAIDASVKYAQVKDRAVKENTAWDQAVDPTAS